LGASQCASEEGLPSSSFWKGGVVMFPGMLDWMGIMAVVWLAGNLLMYAFSGKEIFK